MGSSFSHCSILSFAKPMYSEGGSFHEREFDLSFKKLNESLREFN